MDFNLEPMLFDIQEPMELFTRKLYEQNFMDYCTNYRHILDQTDQAYLAAERPDEVLEELAEELLQAVEQRLALISNRRKREAQLLNYNMTMVSFCFPAMLAYRSEGCDKLTGVIAECWKKHFPKTNIQPANFDQINNGFRSRFCYITTAVCESRHKPDDCYELNLLRDYRDHYVMNQPDGELLIRQYYDVAPTIVKHIGQQENSAEIYDDIWTEYLSPCIRLIEEDRKEECMDVYRSMVNDLQQKYFS